MDKNGEDLYNNFEIKVDPFRFEFAVTSESEIRGKELRFKNDRGYYDKLKKKYFSSIRDLTDNQKRELEDSIINIKAEDMFYDLIEEYDIGN